MMVEVANNAKTGAAVVVWTIGSAAATSLEWLTLNIGGVAMLIGALLSCVLIYTNLRQHFIKMRIMEHELEERKNRRGRRERRDDFED